VRQLLFDTHAFLWLAGDDHRLSDACKDAFLDVGHDCLLSMASVWEMAIQLSLGRLTLGRPLRRLIEIATREQGIALLDIRLDHVLHVSAMAWHHRDPFDRLIAAQALVEGVKLVSKDSAFDAYGVTRIW
jgi:PIN domain nuclease of toxin-antitoxin system